MIVNVRWGGRQCGKTTWLRRNVPIAVPIVVRTYAMKRRYPVHRTFLLNELQLLRADRIAFDDIETQDEIAVQRLMAHADEVWMTFTVPDEVVKKDYWLRQYANAETKLNHFISPEQLRELKRSTTERYYHTQILGGWAIETLEAPIGDDSPR